MPQPRLTAQRVYRRLAEQSNVQHTVAAPWISVMKTLPPSERIIRPALQSSRVGRKASKMFQPVRITYPEDKLRADFFGDHPWELARPRVLVENDGRDHERFDWSRIVQPGKQLNGESVVQRQKWLMENESLSKPAAYDKARKEFYDHRHREQIELRMAKEEALATGAHFGPGPLEIGMKLEDKAFEHWKAYAFEKRAQVQAAQSAGVLPQSEDDDEAVDRQDDDMNEDESEVLRQTKPSAPII